MTGLRLLPALALALLLPGPAAQTPAPTPKDPARQARRLLMAKRIEEALILLDKALAATPGDPDLHLLTARALYLRGARTLETGGRLTAGVVEDMELAAEEAEKVLAIRPGSRDAHMVVAQSLYQRGLLDEAEKRVRLVLTTAPDDGGANFLIATVLFARSGLEADKGKAAALRKEARPHYRKAIKVGKRVAESYRRLGDIIAIDGLLDKALPLYLKALSLDKDQADHRYLLQACPPAEGVKLYRQAAAARLKAGDRQGAAQHWFMVGLFEEKGQEWKRARDAAAKALALDSEGQWRAKYRIGWCSWWIEDRKVAVRTFLELVRSRRKQFCDLLRNLGAEGRTAAAMMGSLANDAVKAGRRHDARDLSLLLAVVRGRGDDWNNYAFLCRETGRYEDAWYGYSIAIKKSPDNPRFLNDAGLILHYHLRRDLDLARKLYTRAIEHARRILKDKEARPEVKSQAQEALRDASNNLRRLGRR